MKRRIMGEKLIMLSVGIFFLVGIFIFGHVHSSKAAVTSPFSRYTALGSTGPDIKYLQQLLNSDPATRVALSGPGSAGFETNYFGPKTQQALINFQKLHRNDLIYGYAGYSGAVDGETLVLLNNYATKGAVQVNGTSLLPSPLISTTTQQQNQLNADYRAGITVIPGFPYIDSVSPQNVTNGDFITIYGRYFSTSTPNVIRLTTNQVSAVSTDGRTLRIPMKSHLNDLFDKQMKNQDAETRKKAIQRTGEIPLFLTVQNEKGVSNPFMIYFKFK